MARKSNFKAKADVKSIHVVSAWATDKRLVFGQVKTEEKRNEITAIPVLLGSIALEGSIVTIDAMGCRYEIADKIVGEKKGDYVFSLKGNQGRLYGDVEECFGGLDFSAPAGKSNSGTTTWRRF
jgi:hypothetical protein